MELYLVQHGEAASETADPARPLTARGRDEVARAARAARSAAPGVAKIYHSGKLRAEQTAEILAAEVQPKSGVSRMEGLAPNDDPVIAKQAVLDLSEPAMLVGHLPHLSRLAALLLTGDPARDVIAFRMGGIVCLVRGEGGVWRVRWALTPELLA